MKNQMLVIFFLAGVSLLLLFQNCSNTQIENGLGSISNKTNISDTGNSNIGANPNLTVNDGNGQPYDGKIFVRNKSCNDGTQVESRIVLSDDSKSATMYRQDCQTGTPIPIAISQVRFDLQNSNSLYYKDQEFVKEKPSIPLPGVVSWYYQLTGILQIRAPSIYIIDLYDHTVSEIADLKKNGHTVICSMSGGTVEDWNPDARLFPIEAIGNQVKGGAKEHWINTQNTGVRSIMLERLNLARDKGCHGIDFDSVDGYANNTGFPLTMATQLEYNQFLAFAAHDRNLILSLNNAPELAPVQANIFDFAIAEECFKYNECSAYQSFIQRQKPVLAIEYTQVSQTQCSSAKSLLISLAYFSPNLDGSRFETCPVP